MKIVECSLTSLSAYAQGKYYTVEKRSKELPGDYEKRTWRERCHYDAEGMVFIPPMAFANSLKEAAMYLSLSIPGKGQAKYTKHFESGVMVSEPLPLNIHKDNIEPYWMFVPSDGKRGGGSRVEKCFPVVPTWSGKVTYYILDDIITEDVFQQVIDTSGNLIGIGSFRPRNRGYFGRFKVDEIVWADY